MEKKERSNIVADLYLKKLKSDMLMQKTLIESTAINLNMFSMAIEMSKLIRTCTREVSFRVMEIMRERIGANLDLSISISKNVVNSQETIRKNALAYYTIMSEDNKEATKETLNEIEKISSEIMNTYTKINDMYMKFKEDANKL